MRRSSARRPSGAALAVAVALLAGCDGRVEPTEAAQLVLLNGSIVTLDPLRPTARALAARGGRIVAVGDDAEIEPLVGRGTEVIDLQGRLAIPGFIEGHGHFAGIGRSKMNLDLRGARSWQEVVRRVALAAEQAESGQWILGWGWHQEKWETLPADAVEGYPVHLALSAATPDNPVLLKHAAGNHAGLINARAMELAGIDAATADPAGGKILRDASGRPTGVLQETAYALATKAHERSLASATPEQREAWMRREVELAEESCLAVGVTSFQDAGSDFETIELLRRMAQAGELGVRLWVMLLDEPEQIERRVDEVLMQGVGADHLTVRAIKQEMDGALGSHGAWLLEPYSDRPDSSGHNTTPIAQLERIARIAAAKDLQLCVHAIGDRANRETLDLFERTLRDDPRRLERRWRVEHAQHLSPLDVPRFAELGVIASMQGVHCTSDGPWVPERLGAERSAEGAYLWRSLIDSGAIVSNGTDAPIEEVDPIANFHASVTRRMADGGAFHPEQRMTRMEALRSATIDAAYAAFEEPIKGSLTPGKLADIVVLSRNILEAPDEEILGAEVTHTIVGGLIMYAKGE